MDVFRIGQVFSRGDSTGLYTVNPTLQEVRFAKGLAWTLRKMVEKKAKSKGREHVTHTSKILGLMWYNELYKGKKLGWSHELVFAEENSFEYEEVRHGLQLAIFHLTGLFTVLQVSFALDKAIWTLQDGTGMREHLHRRIEIVPTDASQGVVDLSRVVTRDIKTEGNS